MKKTIFLIFCILSVLCTLSVAGDPVRTLELTDMVGRHLTVPVDPERIVCIGPGALRLIVYLQAETKVVGVEDMEKRNSCGRPYWMAHPELSRLPRCGPGGPTCINKKPDLEAILSVAPQVIFTVYMEASLADEVQRILGIPLVVLSYGDFATFDETVYDSILLAGKILGRDQRAGDVITYIESLRADLTLRTKNIPVESKSSVYIGGIGYRGAQGIESTQKSYIPFQWVSADNIVEQRSGVDNHLVIDKEVLLTKNPDFIFIDGGGAALVAEEYRKKPHVYRVLNAFSNDQVYMVHPFNWYATNIGTALADAYAIGKILYEDRFDSMDPEQKADEIYTFLVGSPVSDSMRKEYGPLGQKARFGPETEK
jgi:iron complex transport system substrate-binding protein